MADWTASQWIIIPLIILGDAVVAASIAGMFLYALYAIFHGVRQPVVDVKANTPKQRA